MWNKIIDVEKLANAAMNKAVEAEKVAYKMGRAAGVLKTVPLSKLEALIGDDVRSGEIRSYLRAMFLSCMGSQGEMIVSERNSIEYVISRGRCCTSLDPLVFMVPKGTDLRSDDVDAHLLMCFGVDMPLDFFLRRGLVQVESNGYYNQIVKVCD